MNFEHVHNKLIELVRELAPVTDPGVMLAALENVTLQAKHAYLHALAGNRVKAGGKKLPKAKGGIK